MDCGPLKKIPHVLTVDTISSWDNLLEQRKDFGLDDGLWIFRGEAKATEDLSTSFEKAKGDSKTRAAWRDEAAILREFRRRAHYYIPEPLIFKNVLEWFALMRHYGAPCRLLDCTYFFHIAVYFALKREDKTMCQAAVRAFNTKWLSKCRQKIFSKREREFRFKDPNKFYKYFLNPKKPTTFVSDVNPLRMNQRLTAQQGLFLCPGNIEKPFMENLLNMTSYIKDPNCIIRIPIAYTVRAKAILELQRMNISSASLFPDLAGFAESLSDWFLLPFKYNDDELKAGLKGIEV
jgi:hypothetical protein